MTPAMPAAIDGSKRIPRPENGSRIIFRHIRKHTIVIAMDMGNRAVAHRSRFGAYANNTARIKLYMAVGMAVTIAPAMQPNGINRITCIGVFAISGSVLANVTEPRSRPIASIVKKANSVLIAIRFIFIGQRQRSPDGAPCATYGATPCSAFSLVLIEL